MLIAQSVTYTLPNRDVLFSDLNLAVHHYEKIALTGNNGAGKSTLLKILAGGLQPSNGVVHTTAKRYYVPQHVGQFNDYTIAQALGVHSKLAALKDILAGNVSESNLIVLDDDWTVEERCHEALVKWHHGSFSLDQRMDTLSGGQKTCVFLAGITIHSPQIVLLDEPGNHLDRSARHILYDYIQSTTDTLVVVSHDRMLLNLLNTVYELGNRGLVLYGGNYDFYVSQKKIEREALQHEVDNHEKELRKIKATERKSMERQHKLDARGKKKQEKAGLPTIAMNTFRNNAENSTARLKDVHEDKVNAVSAQLHALRDALPDLDKMKLNLHNTSLHKGKVLIDARDINFKYNDHELWNQGQNIKILSADRIGFIGGNGSGKTTLLKLMLGMMRPTAGHLYNAGASALYVDQDYSLIDNSLTVYEQVQRHNTSALHEHELKVRLNRFLFTKGHWDKPCGVLSGGEKMRLMLCCLTGQTTAPDILVLDEPTNNLDIQNIEILTAAINQYAGTLLVVTHDEYFMKEINLNRFIEVQ